MPRARKRSRAARQHVDAIPAALLPLPDRVETNLLSFEELGKYMAERVYCCAVGLDAVVLMRGTLIGAAAL